MSDEETGSNEGAEVESAPSASFLDGVDSQFREDPSVSKFTNVNDLVKEHVNLQSLLGRKGVIVPNSDDSPDIWNKYRSEMGIPDSHEGYEIPPDQSNDVFQKLAEASFDANLTADQYTKVTNALSAWQDSADESMSKDAESIMEENLSSLRKEWGRSFEAKTNIGASALNKLTGGNPDRLASLQLSDGTQLGNDPAFIKMMAEIGSSFQEKGLLEGSNANHSAMSPEEAASKLSQIMADPEKSAILFSQDYHPSKDELVKERERLLSFAYPED